MADDNDKDKDAPPEGQDANTSKDAGDAGAGAPDTGQAPPEGTQDTGETKDPDPPDPDPPDPDPPAAKGKGIRVGDQVEFAQASIRGELFWLPAIVTGIVDKKTLDLVAFCGSPARLSWNRSKASRAFASVPRGKDHNHWRPRRD